MERHIFKMELTSGNKITMFYGSKKKAIVAATTFLQCRGAKNIEIEKGVCITHIVGIDNTNNYYHSATVEVEILH